ncbi:MAG: hypothetical protein KDC71_22470 [Acidobacteria bacterium]|nr:hypothetical protein [Acidobacteriota bacterium]
MDRIRDLAQQKLDAISSCPIRSYTCLEQAIGQVYVFHEEEKYSLEKLQKVWPKKSATLRAKALKPWNEGTSPQVLAKWPLDSGKIYLIDFLEGSLGEWQNMVCLGDQWYALETDRRLYVAHLISEFQYKPMALEYAQSLHLTDCLIDRHAPLFMTENERQTYCSQANEEAIKAWNIIQEFPIPAELEWKDSDADRDSEEYRAVMQQNHKNEEIYTEKRNLYIKTQLQDANNVRIFKQALAQTVCMGSPDFGMAEDALNQGFAKEALAILSSNQRVGQCSQDRSPRYQMQKIANLAALNGDWSRFIQSHLNLMSDRFPRQTDGSYAWAGRLTYGSELEALGLPMEQFLMGLALDVPMAAHYHMPIGRLSRTLDEMAYWPVLMNDLMQALEDSNLDPWNRMRLAILVFGGIDAQCPDQANSIIAEYAAGLPDYIQTLAQMWLKRD